MKLQIFFWLQMVVKQMWKFFRFSRRELGELTFIQIKESIPKDIKPQNDRSLLNELNSWH